MDCGAPPSLDDGAVSVAATTFLSEALYSCNDTLTIVGGDLRVCQSNMTWSGGEITCESKRYIIILELMERGDIMKLGCT